MALPRVALACVLVLVAGCSSPSDTGSPDDAGDGRTSVATEEASETLAPVQVADYALIGAVWLAALPADDPTCAFQCVLGGFAATMEGKRIIETNRTVRAVVADVHWDTADAIEVCVLRDGAAVAAIGCVQGASPLHVAWNATDEPEPKGSWMLRHRAVGPVPAVVPRLDGHLELHF